MLPFSNYGPLDRSERKALLLAIAASLLFIVVIAVVHPISFRRHHRDDLLLTEPVRPRKFLEPVELPARDSLERFRVVPRQFQDVNFTNFTYGLYKLSNGQTIDLTLSNGELELPDNLGSFTLKEVFYRDVTGDWKPEAIAWLSHVQCQGPCDGGANIFYIYTAASGTLKPIWQYETGSYAYGCGLKSFTITRKQVVLELFGNCAKESIGERGAVKFVADGLTFIVLEFNGQRFAQQSRQFVPTSPNHVKNYEPSIRIY
jgi:hypothetical protein